MAFQWEEKFQEGRAGEARARELLEARGYTVMYDEALDRRLGIDFVAKQGDRRITVQVKTVNRDYSTIAYEVWSKFETRVPGCFLTTAATFILYMFPSLDLVLSVGKLRDCEAQLLHGCSLRAVPNVGYTTMVALVTVEKLREFDLIVWEDTHEAT